MDAPVITDHFHINQESVVLKRYGMWWKIVDLVVSLGADFDWPFKDRGPNSLGFKR